MVFSVCLAKIAFVCRLPLFVPYFADGSCLYILLSHSEAQNNYSILFTTILTNLPKWPNKWLRIRNRRLYEIKSFFLKVFFSFKNLGPVTRRCSKIDRSEASDKADKVDKFSQPSKSPCEE